MVILIAGGSGFIGGHLAAALAAAGHEVVVAGRSVPAGAGARHVPADFTRDLAPEAWLPRLAGIDVVVNAVGIIRERGANTFERLHRDAPRALFAACAAAGVRRIVQISALGADAAAASRYHRSKREADEALASQSVPYVIAQPSLVYGPGGGSARLFDTLASLPLIPVPGDGGQRLQPIHVDDLTTALVALCTADAELGRRVALVGPEAITLRTYLARLRRALQLPPAPFVHVPMALVRLGAALGSVLPAAPLDGEMLAMLERGNTADPSATRRVLRREPRPVESFVAPREAQGARALARLRWTLPLLRWSVAIVWIATGIVSMGLYPVDESYALLARVGIAAPLAPVFLYGAALLDLGLGIGALALRRRFWIWWAQIAVIVGYTAVITWKLPEFWLHPYGPLTKNLPMLAAIALLLVLEEKER